MTYHTKALCLATALSLGTGAQAASITVQAFDSSIFSNWVTGNTVVEDFETRGDLTASFEVAESEDGPLNNDADETYGVLQTGTSLSSKVGSFTGLAQTGIGTGNTCKSLNPGGNNCENIALQFDPDLNGQGNIVPDDGAWAINAADTRGIEWSASLGGREFTSLFFAVRDAADQGAKFTVTAGDQSVEFTDVLNNGNGLLNDTTQLVMVEFGTAVDFALITMESSKVNDSFSLDGAAITPVPLPAAGWLMIAGLGGLAALRRRKRTA